MSGAKATAKLRRTYRPCAMAEYGLQIFGRAGKPASITLPFDSDAQAIAFLGQHAREHRRELWHGERLVKQFEAEQAPILLPDDPAPHPPS
jgi:hypothetical protein